MKKQTVKKFICCVIFVLSLAAIFAQDSQEKPATKTKQEITVVIASQGKRYHYPRCHTIKKKHLIAELSIAEAKKRGYTRCGVCKPPEN